MLTRSTIHWKVLTVGERKTRRNWLHIHVPPDLMDLIQQIGKREGYPPERIHFFLYALLKERYPDAVQQAADFFNIDLNPLDEGVIPPED